MQHDPAGSPAIQPAELKAMPTAAGAESPQALDREKNSDVDAGDYYVGTAQSLESPNSPEPTGRFASIKRHQRPVIHLFIFLLFTGWWIASLVLHRKDKNWVVPFLLWLAITLRLVTFYIPARYALVPLQWVWHRTATVVYHKTPERFRTLGGAAIAIAAILVGAFVSEETADNTRANRAISLFGLVVILFGFWATSRHRSRVNWRTVIVGMLMQYVIGLFVLRTGVGYDIFKWIADRAGDLLGFARDGVAFLTNPTVAATGNFFFGVLPAIIFFISIVQVLYYFGFVQWFVKKAAFFVFWAMGVTGAEAVVAAATPFIGQGESAMLVRPFVPLMTKAELHQVSGKIDQHFTASTTS